MESVGLTDKVSIQGLALDAFIGIHEWEQQQQQPIVIDLDLFFDTTNAARSDKIEDTVSYGDICRSITTLVEASHFQLIEALAGAIADMVFDTYPVPHLVLSVSKPNAVPLASNISVTIERRKP